MLNPRSEHDELDPPDDPCDNYQLVRNQYTSIFNHTDDPCDSCEDSLWLWTHYRELCDDRLMDTHSV